MDMIEFKDLTKNKVRNLTGHERGVAARERYNLDKLDLSTDVVRIVVPNDLDAITTSFFQGMFAKSVRSFPTSDLFLSHYLFEASPTIVEQIMRGIDRVKTKRGAAFTKA